MKNNKSFKKKGKNSPKIHTGNYTGAAWRALGPEGQAKVRALRDKIKKATKETKEQTQKRSISFAEGQKKGNQDVDDEEGGDHSQFGRSAYGDAKKAKKH